MFDLYKPTEDHDELRAAVRAVVDKEIAPFAAEVDAEARYPQEAHDALVSTDFFAAHVPEEYEGVGADALAVAIIIEEVARGCMSASLIPAVNKIGSMPLPRGGSGGRQHEYITQ